MRFGARTWIIGLLVALPVGAVLAGRFLFVNRDLLGAWQLDPLLLIPSLSIAMPLVAVLSFVNWALVAAGCRQAVAATAIVGLAAIYGYLAWRAAGIRADSDALWLASVWWVTGQAVFSVGVLGSVMAVVVLVVTKWRGR